MTGVEYVVVELQTDKMNREANKGFRVVPGTASDGTIVMERPLQQATDAAPDIFMTPS